MNKYQKVIDALTTVIEHCDNTDCSVCPLDNICYDTLFGGIVLYKAVRRAKLELEHTDE